MAADLQHCADHRLFRTGGESFVFGVEDASVYALSEAARAALCRLRRSGPVDAARLAPRERRLLEGLRAARLLRSAPRPPAPASPQRADHCRPSTGKPPLATLVLEVAQDCNLRCTYCYADAGTYGAKPCLLAPEQAVRAVRYLLDNSGDLNEVTLVFFGGEPLLNLPAVRAAIGEAHAAGEAAGKRVRFSLTTNGTLLDRPTAAFLHRHRVSVAVSLDGPRDVHDRNRPDAAGGGSYAGIVARLGSLLDNAPVPVAARVTLVPDQWHRTEEVFDHLIGLGFHEVGIAPVSPVTAALLPTPAQEAELLRQFGRLAERFLAEARAGRLLPFANLLDLLARLHVGQVRSMGCGAGFSYLAMDARGGLFPCHRLVGEAGYCIGRLSSGIDRGTVTSCFAALDDGRRDACARCWARTLCAGGCHYENHLRERTLGLPRGSSCRFIRRWLERGLKTYVALRRQDVSDALCARLAQRARH